MEALWRGLSGVCVDDFDAVDCVTLAATFWAFGRNLSIEFEAAVFDAWVGAGDVFGR